MSSKKKSVSTQVGTQEWVSAMIGNKKMCSWTPGRGKVFDHWIEETLKESGGKLLEAETMATLTGLCQEHGASETLDGEVVKGHGLLSALHYHLTVERRKAKSVSVRLENNHLVLAEQAEQLV